MGTTLAMIGSCKFKRDDIIVFRDQHGKFYLKVNGVTTYKRLFAKDVVMVLLNMMRDVR